MLILEVPPTMWKPDYCRQKFPLWSQKTVYSLGNILFHQPQLLSHPVIPALALVMTTNFPAYASLCSENPWDSSSCFVPTRPPAVEVTCADDSPMTIQFLFWSFYHLPSGDILNSRPAITSPFAVCSNLPLAVQKSTSILFSLSLNSFSCCFCQ